MSEPEPRQNLATYSSSESTPIVHPKSLWHFVFDGYQFKRDWNKPLFIDSESGESVTLGQVKSLSKRLAHGMLRNGFKQGDTVLFVGLNSPDYGIAHWSCQAAGFTATYANPAYTETELFYQANDSQVQMILTDAASLPLAQTVVARLGLNKNKAFSLAKGAPNSIWQFLSEEEHEPPVYSQEQASETAAMRCYSSGTTSQPKGVEATHFQLANVMSATLKSCPDEWTSDNVLCCQRPLYHIAGLYQFILLPVYTNCTVVLMRRYNFEAWLNLVQKYKINRLDLLPPMALSIAKSPLVDKYDWSHVKSAMCGSAPFSAELHTEVEKRLGIRLFGGYGMTETTCVISMGRARDRKIGANGKLLANMQARVVEGELQVKGPNIFKRYWNKPEQTKEAFTEDGFLRTGDIVKIDEEGYIFVTDRLKELIKYKGFQVAPAELEGLLNERDDIRDSGVVPFSSPSEATELPLAYVVLKDPASASEAKAEDIVRWTASRLAPYKALRGGIVFIDEIPKNPTGKIMRRYLRDRKGDKRLGLGGIPKKARL